MEGAVINKSHEKKKGKYKVTSTVKNDEEKNGHVQEKEERDT